jgi:hypothetical protein
MRTPTFRKAVAGNGTKIRIICQFLLYPLEITGFQDIASVYPLTSYRSVRNFLIDLRQMPASATATGLHWQVSQATSLFNVVVEMSTDNNTRHQGAIFLRFL